jgi:paraquat-inducible protein B
VSEETPEAARARRRRALLWVVPLLVLLIGGLFAVTLAVGGYALRTMTGG